MLNAIRRRIDNARTFTIFDLPIVPYVRMTQASKYVDENAQRYIANQKTLKLQFKSAMNMDRSEMLPARSPLWVEITMVVTNRLHTKDGDNQVKALFDAMSKVVYPDDRWIDCHSFVRFLGDRDEVVIAVGEMETEKGR